MGGNILQFALASQEPRLSLRPHDALIESIRMVALHRCTDDDLPSERNKKFRQAASDVIHSMCALEQRMAFDALEEHEQERVLLNGLVWEFGNMAYLRDARGGEAGQ